MDNSLLAVRDINHKIVEEENNMDKNTVKSAGKDQSWAGCAAQKRGWLS